MGELALAQESTRTFCTFRAQGRLYGMDVQHVREVSTQSTVTRIPQAPPLLNGKPAKKRAFFWPLFRTSSISGRSPPWAKLSFSGLKMGKDLHSGVVLGNYVKISSTFWLGSYYELCEYNW